MIANGRGLSRTLSPRWYTAPSVSRAHTRPARYSPRRPRTPSLGKLRPCAARKPAWAPEWFKKSAAAKSLQGCACKLAISFQVTNVLQPRRRFFFGAGVTKICAFHWSYKFSVTQKYVRKRQNKCRWQAKACVL